VNTTKKVKSVQTIARFKAWRFGSMSVSVSAGTSGERRSTAGDLPSAGCRVGRVRP
jgi:hypothetical protein